jgi:hypothetical protein
VSVAEKRMGMKQFHGSSDQPESRVGNDRARNFDRRLRLRPGPRLFDGQACIR